MQMSSLGEVVVEKMTALKKLFSREKKPEPITVSGVSHEFNYSADDWRDLQFSPGSFVGTLDIRGKKVRLPFPGNAMCNRIVFDGRTEVYDQQGQRIKGTPYAKPVEGGFFELGMNP